MPTSFLAKATRRQGKQRRQAAAAVTEREPQGGEDEHAVLIAIIIALLGDLSGGALAERLAGILVPFGFSPVAVVALISLLGTDHTTFTPPGAEASTEPALQAMERTEVTRRARYILAAARRLNAGEPLKAENRLLNAHLAAERRRRGAGQRIDAAAAKYGTLLGWYARKDRRTTADCAAAHGCNFLATAPPAIGWPGTLHGGNCRCEPGPPWSQALLLP